MFGRFLRSYAKTDVTTTFSAKFRSRSTNFQLCTTLGAPELVPNTSRVFEGRGYADPRGVYLWISAGRSMATRVAAECHSPYLSQSYCCPFCCRH